MGIHLRPAMVDGGGFGFLRPSALAKIGQEHTHERT
jgi:hypothetical protein